LDFCGAPADHDFYHVAQPGLFQIICFWQLQWQRCPPSEIKGAVDEHDQKLTITTMALPIAYL
jgi:predicted  nucleic acid-binding Zn ribbon protein